MQGIYFENAIAHVDNEHLIKTYKLREGCNSTFLVAECCKTVLMIDHEFYRKNVFAVHLSFANVFAKDMIPSARIFTADWDKEKDPDAPEMPPYTGDGPVIRTMEEIFAFIESADGAYLKKKFAKCYEAPPTNRRAGDKTIQDLMKEPIILGLKEFEHI